MTKARSPVAFIPLSHSSRRILEALVKRIVHGLTPALGDCPNCPGNLDHERIGIGYGGGSSLSGLFNCPETKVFGQEIRIITNDASGCKDEFLAQCGDFTVGILIPAATEIDATIRRQDDLLVRVADDYNS